MLVRYSAAILGWLLLVPMLLAGNPERDPQELLQELTENILQEVQKDPAQLNDVNRVRELAERHIIPHIDFDAAAQWVLGKYWRTATDRQRADFVREFRSLLLNTYMRSISNYQNNRITFMPARGDIASGRVEVDVEVELPGGPPAHLAFRMHNARGSWLVYDITVEGVSLVATHRSGFAREISEQGLDSLIARLARKNMNAHTELAVQ